MKFSILPNSWHRWRNLSQHWRYDASPTARHYNIVWCTKLLHFIWSISGFLYLFRNISMLRCRINVSRVIWCHCRHLKCRKLNKFVISRSLKLAALSLFLTKKVSDVNGKAISVQVYCRPWGVQVVEAPRFRENRHMRLVSLSALRAGDLCLHRKYSWHSFDLRV